MLSNETKREDEKDIQSKSLDEEWREQRIDIKKLPYMYLKLSKYRLTCKLYSIHLRYSSDPIQGRVCCDTF